MQNQKRDRTIKNFFCRYATMKYVFPKSTTSPNHTNHICSFFRNKTIHCFIHIIDLRNNHRSIYARRRILIFGTKNLIVSEVMNDPFRFGWEAYSFVLYKGRKWTQFNWRKKCCEYEGQKGLQRTLKFLIASWILIRRNFFKKLCRIREV